MPSNTPEIRLYPNIWMDTENGNNMRFYNNTTTGANAFGFYCGTTVPTLSIDKYNLTVNTPLTCSGDINTQGNIKQNGSTLLPIGSIIMYAGANPPPLYITCAGQSYDRSLFPELFSAIGITHGSASATTFYNLLLKILFLLHL